MQGLTRRGLIRPALALSLSAFLTVALLMWLHLVPIAPASEPLANQEKRVLGAAVTWEGAIDGTYAPQPRPIPRVTVIHPERATFRFEGHRQRHTDPAPAIGVTPTVSDATSHRRPQSATEPLTG